MLTPPTVAKRQQASQELAGRVPRSPANTQPLAEAGALPTSSGPAEARGHWQEPETAEKSLTRSRQAAPCDAQRSGRGAGEDSGWAH